jgi:hypothetical protein
MRQTRNYFFGPTGYGYTKFSTKNKPTEIRFLELFQSVPFFAELESMARNTENYDGSGISKVMSGLVGLPTRKNMLFNYDATHDANNIPIVAPLGHLPRHRPYDSVFEGSGFYIDNNENNIGDSGFVWGSNGTKEEVSRGIRVRRVFLNNHGSLQYFYDLAIDTDHFAFDDNGKLIIAPDSVTDNEIIGPLDVDIITKNVSNNGIPYGMSDGDEGYKLGFLFPVAGEVIMRKSGGDDGFDTVKVSDGDLDSDFTIKDYAIGLSHLERLAKGYMFVGAGTDNKMNTLAPGTEAQMMIMQSTGLQAWKTLVGVIGIAEDGTISFMEKVVYGKHLSDNAIGEGLIWDNYTDEDRRIKAKVRRSIVLSSGYIQLENDDSDPGSSKYYGTNKDSEKGYHTLPSSIMGEGSGTDSIVQQGHSTGTKKYSLATAKGESKWYGAEARAVDDAGDKQLITLQYQGTTSDDIVTEITLAGEASEYFDNLPDSCVLNIEVKVTAYDTDDNDLVHTELIHCAFKNVATVLSEIDSANSISKVEDAGMAGCAVAMVADDANNRLKMTVQGLAATNINWMISAKVDMLKF